MKKSCLLSLVSSLLFLNISAQEDPIIQTRSGNVRGTISKSRSGRPFFQFKGIPYAKPPIGELRFKDPQREDPWEYLYNTQEDAPDCIQKNYLFKNPTVEGSEDCLYLNVYTPELRVKDKRLPVMVFIHWGGFFAGYSSSKYLGPQYFMDENVVLVTFNYRLGVLGFLSTNDDSSPGNYGLKDQRAALEWVQDNIGNFGGDNRKVTIFGQSAGGASVHFHMLSPLSKGLFHQGISESGTALALWAKPLGKERQIAVLQATFVGCDNFLNDTDKLVDCLRTVDATKLVDSGDKFKYFSIDPLTIYLPSIEAKTDNNPRPFLTKQPIEYIKEGEFNPVPWIIGMVSDEGIIRAAPLLSQSQTRTVLNKQFNSLMPILMALFMSTPKEKIEFVWKQIKNFYLNGENYVDVNNTQSIQGLVNLYTDRSFAYTLYQTVLLHKIKNHDPIWLYNFQYRGQLSYGQLFAATTENINYKWGVSHCDELLYLFESPAIFQNLTHFNDISMSEKLIKLWTNFATYGDPTPFYDVFLMEKRWLKIKHNPDLKNNKILHFLNITGNYENNSIYFNMELDFYNDRLRFWEKLPLVENIDDLCQQHVEL